MTASNFDPSGRHLSSQINERFLNNLTGKDLQHPEVLEAAIGFNDRRAMDAFYRLFQQDLMEIPSPDLINHGETDNFFPTSEEMLEALSAMSEGLEKRQVERFQQLVLDIMPMASHQLRGRIILFLFHQWMQSQKRLAHCTAHNVELLIAEQANPESVVMFLKREGD